MSNKTTSSVAMRNVGRSIGARLRVNGSMILALASGTSSSVFGTVGTTVGRGKITSKDIGLALGGIVAVPSKAFGSIA